VKDSIGEKEQTEWRKTQLSLIGRFKFYCVAAILLHHVAAHRSIFTIPLYFLRRRK